MEPQNPPRKRLASFMAERHAIYMRKAYLTETPEGSMSSRMRAAWGFLPSRHHPWSLGFLTHDPILARYRFCNVYRELDAVTVWIREHIREPYADHEHLWFMLAIARHINWPATLAELISGTEPLPVHPLVQAVPESVAFYQSWPSYPGFEPRHMTSVLQRRQARGDKVYTGAYMIRAEQYDHPWRHWPKVRYSAEIVLGRLWEHRDKFARALTVSDLCRCQTDKNFATAAAYSGGCTDCLSTGYVGGPSPSLEEVWQLFQDPAYTGWGPFMAQQVVADMRWTRYLISAPDVGDWTAVGPGSARGLNRLAGRELKKAVSQAQGLDEMRELREWMRTGGLAPYPWLDLPELSDVQNCLCEFDKYERVRLGEGRPRALYVPGRGG